MCPIAFGPLRPYLNHIRITSQASRACPTVAYTPTSGPNEADTTAKRPIGGHPGGPGTNASGPGQCVTQSSRYLLSNLVRRVAGNWLTHGGNTYVLRVQQNLSRYLGWIKSRPKLQSPACCTRSLKWATNSCTARRTLECSRNAGWEKMQHTFQPSCSVASSATCAGLGTGV